MPKICNVEGCSNFVGTHGARGMCSSHYNRWRRHGDPNLNIRCTIKGLYKNNQTEYNIWSSMKSRCQNPNNKGYSYYGGRGIKVCDRWTEKPNGFINFLNDMGERPSKKYSLDRINNNGDYCPDNCRWATAEEQMNNRRPMSKNPIRKNNINIMWHGETHTLAEWGRQLGISYTTLYIRYRRRGIRGDELFAPSRCR